VILRARIVGPESTGKSTLARSLAERFDTEFVPEHAADVIAAQGGQFEELDLLRFAQGQVAAEAALAPRARRVLICDTCPLTTLVWGRLLFGRVAPEVRRLADATRYDLTLLCAPDVPWADDLHRVDPSTRAPFLELLREELGARGVEAVLLTGTWVEREERAAQTLERALGEGPTGLPRPPAAGR
jgi:HTH-type transcriptional regulator, transcriptional repressor of NAD biosynthesis genes